VSAVIVANLTISLWVVAGSLKRLRSTTLPTAAWCAMTGLGSAAVAQSIELINPAQSTGWVDLGWYFAAVVLLCPGIAVLGARRPGASAWAFFVLLPLVLVLMWPAVASFQVARPTDPIEIEVPALVGFGLVLIMSGGNYFGTRYTLSTLYYAAAIVLLVAPMSAAVPDIFPERSTARFIASLAILLAIAETHRRSKAAAEVGISRLDVLWFDFMDSFGMVWAKRVMDRINESARHEKWTMQLELHGFVPFAESPSADEMLRTKGRIEHTFRFLLKRFVDPEWIDIRLRTTPAGQAPPDEAQDSPTVSRN
tara:strand:+ start:98497 stop:99426 length:930 start_codon:yes stop_codon:yes gene_type:complete